MKQLLIQKVRWLQQAEGHRPCFRSGKIVCDHEHECCWASICLPPDYKTHLFEVIE